VKIYQKISKFFSKKIFCYKKIKKNFLEGNNVALEQIVKEIYKKMYKFKKNPDTHKTFEI